MTGDDSGRQTTPWAAAPGSERTPVGAADCGHGRRLTQDTADAAFTSDPAFTAGTAVMAADSTVRVCGKGRVASARAGYGAT